jgi:hypothetical protein
MPFLYLLLSLFRVILSFHPEKRDMKCAMSSRFKIIFSNGAKLPDKPLSGAGIRMDRIFFSTP